MSTKFTAALIQTNVSNEMAENEAFVRAQARLARDAGADFIMTPENTGLIGASRTETLEKAQTEETHAMLAACRAAARDTGGGAERDSAGNTVHETSGTPRAVTKIIASERPATIAEIVSIFRRLARRAPRIATSANRLSAVYARRVQFRSIVSVGPVATPTTTLAIGIAQLMAAERVALMHSTGAEAR